MKYIIIAILFMCFFSIFLVGCGEDLEQKCDEIVHIDYFNKIPPKEICITMKKEFTNKRRNK